MTSVECLSDSSVSSNHGNGDHGDDSDDDIITSQPRRIVRISSNSSSDDDENYNSINNEPPSSQLSSHSDVSSYIATTTDSDTASQESSTSYPATNSNHENNVTSPHRHPIASRLRATSSKQPSTTHDFITSSNYGNHRTWSLPAQSHGNNIKRLLRSHSSVNNGHQLRNSTGSLVKCILSVSDSEQSDVDYVPSYGSRPCSSSSHTHINLHQVKSTTESIQNKTVPMVTNYKRTKRHRHMNRKKRTINKRRKLSRKHHLITTPTIAMTPKRARTLATSPRVTVASTTVADTPQAVIRQLAKARCHTESLEEARRMSQFHDRLTQNDIIARHVRSKQRQALCWDSKIIDCYRSSAKVVCSPLKNAMKRHPMISSSSLK